MRIIRHAQPPGEVALAIGSFDGVHLGHQAMLAHVAREARSRGIASAALTFEPLPREFFARREEPARLTSLVEKLDAVAHAGIDAAIVERFDRDFAAIAAPEFEERIARHYSARWILVGQDFRYGAGRRGDVASLEAAGARLGFRVQVLPAGGLGGGRGSSPRGREGPCGPGFSQNPPYPGGGPKIFPRGVFGKETGGGDVG